MANQTLEPVRIGSLGRVITGKTPPTARLELFGSEYPFITPTDIQEDSRIVETARFLSEDGRAFQKNLLLPTGTVCYTCIGATIGKICITTKPSFTNQQINSIIVDETQHDNRFVFYLLKQETPRIKVNAGGAATPIINKSVFSEIEVNVPPLPSQRRIANILSAYDDLIENNTRRIRILEQMAQANYQEWFGKVDKASLPIGWSVSKFIDVCDELIDGDWIETKDQGGEDYRLLQVSNVGFGDFVETGNFRYVTQATFERLNCNEVVSGDILISRMPKPIGRGWLVTKMPWRMITAVDVAIARPNPDLLNRYYCIHWLNSPDTLAKSEQNSSGTTRPRITRRVLAGFEMVIPPIELQNKFGKFAEELYELQTNLRRKNDNLRQTRDLLLPRLVSGDVEVSSLS
jgi:type I restriction enzyme S subunit